MDCFKPTRDINYKTRDRLGHVVALRGRGSSPLVVRAILLWRGCHWGVADVKPRVDVVRAACRSGVVYERERVVNDEAAAVGGEPDITKRIEIGWVVVVGVAHVAAALADTVR